MNIGRKIYFDSTGKVLYDTGEKTGYVKETTLEEDIVKFNLPNNVRFIQLAYGEMANEFNNFGSMAVNPMTNELTVYPRLTIVSDKSQIVSDGVETATINISNVTGDTVYLKVNDGQEFPVTASDGVAIFQVTSFLPGTYGVIARTEKNGTATVYVEVV